VGCPRDVVSSRDAISYARKLFREGADPQKVADKLAHMALKRYTADNVAVIVVDLGGGPNGWGPRQPSRGGLFGMFGG
jgi:serine/threonine protein phosphatase PrpC